MFANVTDARRWGSHFVSWYNSGHRHSGIRHVSPARRHLGQHRWFRRGCVRRKESGLDQTRYCG